MSFGLFCLFAIVLTAMSVAIVACVVERNNAQHARKDRLRRDALSRAQRRAIFSAYGR